MSLDTGVSGLTTRAVVDLIAMGMVEDSVIDDHVSAMASCAGPDELRFAARQIANITLTVGDVKAVARSLKALKSFLPLETGLENAIDNRLLSLIDGGSAEKYPELAEGIAFFIYMRVRGNPEAARPYLPALLSFLGQNMATTGAYSYYTLMIIANNEPGYFGPHADLLVQTLDNPGIAAKTFAMRVMAAVALSHPEYIAGARDALRNLSESGQHGMIKAEASCAYRAIRGLPKSSGRSGYSLLNDPDIARLYETPVWQRAIKGHLSTAYDEGSLPVDRSHNRLSCTRVESRQSKNSGLYEKPAKTPEPGENMQSPDDPAVSTAPGETGHAEVMASPQPPVDEMSVPEIDEVTVASFDPADCHHDLTGAASLQELVHEVQNDFSAKAGNLLDALGMGHLKPGSASGAEDGNHKISAKEFVSSLQKIVREKKSKVL